jgi:hypothetical protein
MLPRWRTPQISQKSQRLAAFYATWVSQMTRFSPDAPAVAMIYSRYVSQHPVTAWLTLCCEMAVLRLF